MQQKIQIYVFLYQNLNEKKEFSEHYIFKIYVFLYQNLNSSSTALTSNAFINLCISILEFKYGCECLVYWKNEKIYVFLYQNLNKMYQALVALIFVIYVFLYQNLNLRIIIVDKYRVVIYVFLYQNLNSFATFA